MDPASFGSALARAGLVRSVEGDLLDRLGSGGLSTWFDPFLPTFGRSALRSGGEVWTTPARAAPTMVAFVDPADALASVFSADRTRVAEVVAARGRTAVYTEFDLGPPAEVFDVFAVRLDGPRPAHRYRHPVRLLGRDEVADAARLMREVLGGADDRWFAGPDGGGDRCFGVSVGGTLAGAAWVSVAGAHARLHSLAVRPGFRRLGVGTDLAFGRLDWATSAGVREAISEIAAENLGSRGVARTAGAAPVGQVRLYPRRPA